MPFEPWQRHERKTAGDQFECKQHDDDEANRKDQCADQRLAGRYGASERQAGRDAENCAGERSADQKVAGRERELAASRADHGRHHVARFDVVH